MLIKFKLKIKLKCDYQMYFTMLNKKNLVDKTIQL